MHAGSAQLTLVLCVYLHTPYTLTGRHRQCQQDKSHMHTPVFLGTQAR
jgi:hypothetical protein